MIIECSRIEQFKEIGNNLPKEVYILYLTEEGDAVLRPKVTSRGRDTIWIRNLSKEELGELAKWWGKAFIVKKVHFKEDIPEVR